jgi:hypothetical protein
LPGQWVAGRTGVVPKRDPADVVLRDRHVAVLPPRKGQFLIIGKRAVSLH